MMHKTGTVKWFDATKCFGLITPDEGGKDIAVSYSGITGSDDKSLAEGQRVVFSIKETPLGLQAIEVKPVEW